MHLLLQTQKVKIPYIKLEDYLPSYVISQFLADSKGYINLSCYKLPFVHVLPSTKKGKLLSISKEIPTQSRFKDYDQLRRYWKNMYGYSLPKNKDGILYYEITFLMPRSNIFTYPSLCVAISPLDIIPDREKELTVTSFLSDMLKKLPKICGNQLQISKEILNATLSSNGSVESKELDTHSSVKCADKLKKNTNITSTSLKTQLVRIHKNQNDSQCFNSTQISAMQSMITSCIGASTSKNMDVNSTEQERISRYFKVQKPHSVINKGVPTQERSQNRIPLKEKLLKFKFNENNNAPVRETDENINIEAMAKNNKLHEVQNKILSNWLKKHSIPHNSKGKKTELINKILSHIRNTQVLKQYRV
ncbi:uncharacterized protein LOC143348261 [Colletes latitarsis]|uniref:uncharacterized protein LOC143348261 n=1 Tax=Colletes latitarsis TaxID=2605962 RepID=UPI0040352AC7